jgi:hypothetical protein
MSESRKPFRFAQLFWKHTAAAAAAGAAAEEGTELLGLTTRSTARRAAKHPALLLSELKRVHQLRRWAQRSVVGAQANEVCLFVARPLFLCS